MQNRISELVSQIQKSFKLFSSGIVKIKAHSISAESFKSGPSSFDELLNTFSKHLFAAVENNDHQINIFDKFPKWTRFWEDLLLIAYFKY